jgi:Fur family ferric uptake transcriptional regulator
MTALLPSCLIAEKNFSLEQPLLIAIICNYIHYPLEYFKMTCTKTLLEKGYRLTPQRIMVVDALHSVETHISAEEIFGKLKEKYPYANISTVYRTLELLKELVLAAQIDIGDGIARYHAREHSKHHHLVCNKCGMMIDLSESELIPLEKALLKNCGFKADLKHLAIFGTCASCRDSV